MKMKEISRFSFSLDGDIQVRRAVTLIMKKLSPSGKGKSKNELMNKNYK